MVLKKSDFHSTLLHIALDKVFLSLSITEEVMGVRARTGFRGLVSMGSASLYTGIP